MHQRILIAHISVALTALVGLNNFAHAQFCDPVETQKITASDAASKDQFGDAVDFSGDVAIVGASHKDGSGYRSGAAYILRFDGTNWLEEAILIPADGATYDYFGHSVAIDGDIAIIGAYADDDAGFDSGAAYIFRYDGNTWVEEAKIIGADTYNDSYFGWSVDIQGTMVVVGSPDHDVHAANAGAAYVFEYDGTAWVETQQLTRSNIETNDAFGGSVSIDGLRIAVGAAWHYPDDHRGKAFVFEYDGTSWVEQAQLIASDHREGDGFGCSISIQGDLILVARPFENTGKYGNGAAYVFRYDGINWFEEHKIVASDAADGDKFGLAVALNGTTAVIGAPGVDDDVIDCGAIYVYSLDGTIWQEDAKIFASDDVLNGSFGDAIAMNDQVALVGAHLDGPLIYAGSVRAIELDCMGRLDAWPDPLIAGSSALFLASGITPDAESYLTYSTTGLGETIIPFLNITLDIENPKQAGSTRIADDFGRVQWYLPIPQNVLGWNLWFQTAQFENKTRVVTTYVVR